MKLEKILDHVNSLEKGSFIKIINNLIESNPKNSKAIEKILNDNEKGLKNADNVVISKILELLETEFSEHIKKEFVNTTSQLDILTDIIIRDGNCNLKLDWFSRLYENELKSLSKKIKDFEKVIKQDNPDISPDRKRDYLIYRNCLRTAYTNDLETNHEEKITDDELSILLTLARELELSQEEVKLINYTIIPIKKVSIDTIVEDLKNSGILFYSKKNNMIYIADEIIRLLRKVRGKEVADKFFKRVLRLLKEPQLNLIAKKHNIDKSLPFDKKIKEILNVGISFWGVLSQDIFRDSTTLTEKKKFLNDLCDKGLEIQPILKGITLEEKLTNLIYYFEMIEKDEKVGISIDGYDRLLMDLSEVIPKLNLLLRDEFELQENNVTSSNFLLDFNIKPRDILEVLSEDDLEKFAKHKSVKSRGNLILNILDSYKDTENIYLENFENIGFRDINTLKENGIKLKETDLGLKFEEITRSIFSQLGFNVDEKLKRKINTKKDKIDILLNLNNNELILIECKTVKESGYNKFSSVSRQMKSYATLAKKKGYKIIKSLLIAPDFSDDFISDTELEFDINLSLITASSLVNILKGFKSQKINKYKQLPYKLLLKDVLIKEDRILKALS
ncbi:MAG: hypothetical protein ACFFD1_02700 [Candidatus Thorarchaeota archaeon]